MKHEPVVFAASLCPHKRCAVDGGADQGTVTSLLLGLGFEQIIAVEPGPKFDRLQARFREVSNVTCLQAALGHVHNQMVWFGGVTSNKTPKLWYADPDRPGLVRMVRFDHCFPTENSIDLVKLDLEGGELRALMGMKHTLVTNRPVVVCETADWLVQQKDGPGRKALFEYMDFLNYEVVGRFKGDTVWKAR